MGGRLSVSKSKSHDFQCLVNGTALPIRSCQFGTMCTEPAVPHSLQKRRRPIVDQGKCRGRVSSRTSTMRRSHLPPEHWMLQVRCPSAIHSAGLPGGYLPVHRECGRGEAIADDSAAAAITQIINPLGIGTVRSYSASWLYRELSVFRCRIVIAFQVRAMDVRRSLVPIE